MPPTRGHDLKPAERQPRRRSVLDAPHTGARLETDELAWELDIDWMPPTRGHDLKLGVAIYAGTAGKDAPHTGARLETSI